MKASGIGLLALVLISFSAAPGRGYPGEERVLSSRAMDKYQAGDYEAAEELYRRASEAVGHRNAIIQYNLGVATYKAGKEDEAEKIFRSVYDKDNRQLNAAARYNLGVIDHKRAEPIVEKARSLPSLHELPPEQQEELKKEIEKGIEHLEAAERSYRDAILQAPGDRDLKINYEVADRDLEFLRRKLEELEPPPQQQNQQDQQQQNQDQQQQSQQGQDQNQNQQQNQEQNQQNQQQNESQQSRQQNNQQPRQDQQSNQQQQNQNNDQQKDEGRQDEQKDEEPQEDEQKEEPRKGDQKGQPQRPSDGSGGSENQQQPEEPTPGEMSERDVERLLNALPSDNSDALQRLLNVRQSRETDMERDW